MQFNIIEKLKQQFLLPKTPEKITKKVLGYNCSAELESLRGTLKLQQHQAGVSDGWTTYFVNRDGSGRKVTAWGAKNFPKNTFSELLKTAQEMRSKNSAKILNSENAQTLIKEFENKISSNNL